MEFAVTGKDSLLIDFGEKNNLGIPQPPGFVGYPQPPPLPTMPFDLAVCSINFSEVLLLIVLLISDWRKQRR